ncbi:MAG: hypothetical protein SGPRY_008567 [Prymnesium sp.]
MHMLSQRFSRSTLMSFHHKHLLPLQPPEKSRLRYVKGSVLHRAKETMFQKERRKISDNELDEQLVKIEPCEAGWKKKIIKEKIFKRKTCSTDGFEDCEGHEQCLEEDMETDS